ncbi:MAG TPA: SLBB domain-containing protein [Gemmatimonadaceae bacterium]|nr:SLBB domain-containing protein [Gemmatimonadaceae bacterium]
MIPFIAGARHPRGSVAPGAWRVPLGAAFLTLALITPPGAAQTPKPDGAAAYRPLAERGALERVVADLGTAAPAAVARTRLRDGDFRPGDFLLLEVQGEEALTDTFTVAPDLTVLLPPPIVGALPLKGVLRSELQDHAATFVRRFVRDAVVRARPLMRLSVQGELVRPGFYHVPADAALGEALMAAGGTRPEANLKTLRIERDGKPIMSNVMLQRAIEQGLTLDQVQLRGGEVIAVDRKPNVTWVDGLRVLSLVVSISVGLYGLSRAF